ncbi:hypothetical protein [Pseudoalteromonas sp.]|uniref:hypothetical protein n=1 Tax=Pseudoalteromonas sp. TaxID=53249 RepID=UPI0023634461|nr:hypothetical protein [Pseudoalteromonas sp.]MCP4587850.1 hypothetical protein [Pseudoalteromonas sp.]MDC3188414.1 hypothetical protein [Pseudoalteromonas elyakovii]
MQANIDDLKEKYVTDKVSKPELGAIRRHELSKLLGQIQSLTEDELICWLDKKRTKLNIKKIASAIGYKTEAANIRQSFKSMIVDSEEFLRKKGVLSQSKDTNKNNVASQPEFMEFLNSRLSNKSYEWPVNNRNRLFHRVIWAFYLDQPIDEVSKAPQFFYTDNNVKKMLAKIDGLITNEEVKTLSYATEAALDEMHDNMTSAKISRLQNQIKTLQEKLISIQEENRELIKERDELKTELNQNKIKEDSLKSGDISLIKIAGAH